MITNKNIRQHKRDILLRNRKDMEEETERELHKHKNISLNKVKGQCFFSFFSVLFSFETA